MVSLHDVFGIAEHVKKHSYVDRGGLDAQLRYLLGAERHVVMHGGSKQGKTWLRSRILPDESSILVQCQTGTTVESLLVDILGVLGVRAELRRTAGGDFEGKLDFKGSGSIGTHLLGKLGMEVTTGGRRLRSERTETQPVGRAPGNLSWVARTILASERRVVIEDCHYLAETHLRDLAFILKALGGYGVHVVVAGIWPQDHLLTYYNGDLSGRVEDVHLTWSDGELDDVLRTGSRILKIDMSSNLRDVLIADAAGNVGLLQQLAEAVCREERIYDGSSGPQYLTPGPSLERARSAVANSMRQRFQAFAENFQEAATQVRPRVREPLAVLQALLDCDDAELQRGIDSDLLAVRMVKLGHPRARATAVGDLLECLTETQAAMAVRPPVVTYNAHAGKAYLADQSLLFFRRYGAPRWPWRT
jgi:hypothetical protein